MSASFAKPEGKGPFPAVVLLHSCGGVDTHMSVWSDFLTARGYAVLTVDSFGSRGLGRCPNGTSPIFFSQTEMVSDAYGALDYLAAQPDIAADRVYVMGFSLGGWTISTLAAKPSFSREGRNFKAGMVLYAPCYYQGRLTFPTMVVIGSLDGPEIASCELAIERKTSPDLEVHILEGVYHAFDQDRGTTIRYDVGGRPMLYNRGAVYKSEQLVEAFLAKHR
ncbi:MAG TPA: alpha/beta fold hydrolase [Alphaproteobacteria bacterium]